MRYTLLALLGASSVVSGVPNPRIAETLWRRAGELGATSITSVKAKQLGEGEFAKLDSAAASKANAFVPKTLPPPTASTDEKKWPYDTSAEQTVRTRNLSPMLDPTQEKHPWEYLKRATVHVIYYADANQDDDSPYREVAAASFMRLKYYTINLGSTDDISDVTCERSNGLSRTKRAARESYKLTIYFPLKDNEKYNTELETANAGTQSLKFFKELGDVVLMDAFGKFCGEEGSLQFWKITSEKHEIKVEKASSVMINGKVVRRVKISLHVEVIDDTLVVEEAKVKWGVDYQEAEAKAEEEAKTGTAIIPVNMADVKRKIKRHQPTAEEKKHEEELLAQYRSPMPKYAKLCRAGQEHANHMKKRGLFSGEKKWAENFEFDRQLGNEKTKSGSIGMTIYKQKYIEVWVSGGIKAKLSVSGALEWDLRKGGLTGANAIVRLDSLAKIAVGAQAAYKKEFTIGDPDMNGELAELAQEIKKREDFPLSPLALGTFFMIGPSFHLEPFLKAFLATSGYLEMGLQAEIQNGVFMVDLKNDKKFTVENLKPKVTPILNLQADVQLGVTAGVRAGFDLGIVLFGWKKGVSLIDEPSVTASTGVSIRESINSKKKQAPLPAGACEGVYWNLYLSNRLYFEMDLFKKDKFTILNPEFFRTGYCMKNENIKALLLAAGKCFRTDVCGKEGASSSELLNQLPEDVEASKEEATELPTLDMESVESGKAGTKGSKDDIEFTKTEEAPALGSQSRVEDADELDESVNKGKENFGKMRTGNQPQDKVDGWGLSVEPAPVQVAAAA